MNNKLAIRLIIGLFIIAALVLGFQWWRGIKNDPDFGHADTVDMVGAIEQLADGDQAVIFQSDGKKISSPGYRESAVDRDLVWQPDGERVFFISDRSKGIHMFRWNPVGDVQQRSVDGGSKGSIMFGPVGDTPAEQSALITSGGRVLRYDPKVPATYQELPPKERERASGEEGGAGGQFEVAYSKIGNSFKKAVWSKDRKSIVAVMRRDGGEVLVVQSMTGLRDLNTGEVRLLPPTAITAAKKVDFDIAANGVVVIAMTGFQFPDPDKIPKEFIKNGKVVPPYDNAIIYFNPDDITNTGMKAIYVFPDAKGAAMQPAISPDGSKVLLSIGPADEDGNIQFAGIVAMPVTEGGGGQGAPVVRGPASQPSWHPSGNKITYIKTDTAGKRSIFVANADGSEERNLSASSGNYSHPVFSPQLPTAQ